MSYIYLSSEIANEAVRDKSKLESLAFSMMIKLVFKSSTLKSKNIRYCKELFHIGTSKMSRVMKGALKYGYIRIENGRVIANPFKEYKAYNVKVDRIGLYSKTQTVNIKINQAIDIIRKAVLINHISKQNNCFDTFRKSCCPSSVKQYRKAKRTIKKLCKTKKSCVGLSNKRIATVTNTKVYRARKMIRELVSSSVVSRNRRAVKTNIPAKDFNRERVNYFYKSSGKRGYFFYLKGAIYCRISNEYHIQPNKINYVLNHDVPKN